MKSKEYNSPLDTIIIAFDRYLRQPLIRVNVAGVKRPYPANNLPELQLSENEKCHISGLMRVNHAGEIAAQALYKAQSLTAREKTLKITMRQSADEEIDHLYWCETRLKELDSHISYLKPLWWVGSFGIGLVAGAFGDKWNLGFLAETEYQVVKHLDSHLNQLPERDLRSRAILEQMREDELGHAVTAEIEGAANLAKWVKKLMHLTSNIMTKTAYYL